MRATTFATVIGLALASAAAQAQITIWDGPGNFFGDENVLFNDRTLSQEGNHVQGHLNRSGAIVDFFSSSYLKADGGQAKIEGFGKKETFSDLRVQMNDPNLGISTLIWNLNATADGTVTFTVNHSGGVYTETFSLDKNGENWFRIKADVGTISSVSFLTDVGIQDVKQVRIGASAVPEPGTLIGLGLGAVALLRRRNKKK